MPSTSTMSSAASSSSTLSSSPPLNIATPLQSSRYNPVEEPLPFPKRHKMFPSGPFNTDIGELDRYMHDLGTLPSEWKQFNHTDGKPYFQHTVWGVVTEAYVFNPVIRSKLEEWYRQVDAARSIKKPQLGTSGKRELYLTLDPKPGYYFADHESKSVFWLDDLPLKQLGLSEHTPAMSFELFIERNYYRHLENFPNHNELPEDAEASLRGALIHACTEHMTSRDSSTAPWNAEDCKTFLDLLDSLKDATPAKSGYKTWFVSRLLCNILYSRWLYRYGMYGARTDRLASLELPRPRLILSGFGDLITGVFFFCAPYTYVERLEKLWADRIVSLDGWQKLLTSLLVEWSDSNLLATVTLSANMAFLALNDINSISRTASIASTLFAIGSIVIGIHHVWRHRVNVDTTAKQAATYLQNSTRAIPSLKFLALFLSLPLVMLSWSLIIFAFSITMYAFYDRPPWWSSFIMGAALFAVVVVVGSSILFFFGIFSPGQGKPGISRALWNSFFSFRRRNSKISQP